MNVTTVEATITKLIESVKDDISLTTDQRVNKVLNQLTIDELKELAYPLVQERLLYVVEARVIEKSYPHQTTPIYTSDRFVAREVSKIVERDSARDAERKAIEALKSATTLNQKIAAFVSLKQFKVSLGDGVEVPWHEMTSQQMTQRAGMLTKQIGGMMTTRRLLDEAASILKESKTATLREAEKKSYNAGGVSVAV